VIERNCRAERRSSSKVSTWWTVRAKRWMRPRSLSVPRHSRDPILGVPDVELPVRRGFEMADIVGDPGLDHRKDVSTAGCGSNARRPAGRIAEKARARRIRRVYGSAHDRGGQAPRQARAHAPRRPRGLVECVRIAMRSGSIMRMPRHGGSRSAARGQNPRSARWRCHR